MTRLLRYSVLGTVVLVLQGSPSNAHFHQTRATVRHATGGSAGDSAENASCRKFVADFYVWYVAQSKNRDPLQVALKRKRAYFSRDLIRALNEDAAAAAKSPGEIVGLDFDPILNSQDFAEKYVPGRVSRRANGCDVEVFSVYDGKKSDVPAVMPELRHAGGQWVFTNFLYKHDGKSDDLLSLLKKMKVERKKSQ